MGPYCRLYNYYFLFHFERVGLMNLNLFYKLMNFNMYLMSSNQYRQYLFYNRKHLVRNTLHLSARSSVWQSTEACRRRSLICCLVTSMIRREIDLLQHMEGYECMSRYICIYNINVVVCYWILSSYHQV